MLLISVTADYAAKLDGSTAISSCVYSQNDCFQSDAATFQNVCAGKASCIAYHFRKNFSILSKSTSSLFTY